MHSNPNVEGNIAARFAELRRLWGLSLSKFAKEIGLTRDHVANIERGRSPLRYVNAARALRADAWSEDRWQQLNPFNPLWLFGVSERVVLGWPALLPEPVSIGLDASLKFSEFAVEHLPLLRVFESATPELASLPESWLPQYMEHWRKKQTQAHNHEQSLFKLMEVLAKSTLKLAPTSATARHVRQQFKETSFGAAFIEIEEDFSANPQHYPPQRKEFSNQEFTKVVRKDNMSPMQDEMQELRARLASATAARNQKAALAKWLGVSLSSVSTWLAGRKEPSGGTTLRLLHWVEQQEAQQKQSAGSVEAPPAPKTQPQESNEKKPRSSPQKR